jgi:hypothetical protein
MFKNATIYPLFFLIAAAGCKTVDSIAVPIHNASTDMNSSTQNIDIPLGENTLHTGMKLKGGRVVIEKQF